MNTNNNNNNMFKIDEVKVSVDGHQMAYVRMHQMKSSE